MSAEPSAEGGGGVLPFPSAETITGSHSGSRPGSFEQPIQPARLPDAQTDATAHLPSGITDRTLRQKLYDNVWTAYWLEFIIFIITLFVGAAAGALIGIFLFPSASPICSFSRVGDWGPWKKCEPICGQKRTRSRNRTLFDLETIDDHKLCINAIDTEFCQALMCCGEQDKTYIIRGGSVHCFNFVETGYTWAQAREVAGKNRVSKLPSIHNEHDSSMVASTAIQSVWIGLRCFRSGYCKWDDGSELDYYDVNLMADSEFPPNVSVACALFEFSDTGQKLGWRLVACNERHPFVNVSVVVPENRPKCSKSPDDCYEFLTKSPLSYYDIEKSKLVIIKNWLQSEFLKTLMADKAEDVKYWIGLRCVVDVNEVDGDQYSDWDHGCRWPDNSSIAFSNWASKQVPRFDKQTTFCVLIDKEGGWHNEPCDNRHPYIEEIENHCDKVGQFIWSHWQTCPHQNEIFVEKRNYTRYRQINVVSNSSSCPQFAPTIKDPYMSEIPRFNYTEPDYQLEFGTFECFPYGGPKADVRCHGMLYEYFDYCYQVGDRRTKAGDARYGAAMISSAQEAKYVIDMIKNRSDHKPENLFHVGLKCSKSHFEYCYWIHNWIWQKLSFHMFADGEPRVTDDDHQCVALRMPQGDWVSVYCGEQIPTIWEYRPYCDKTNISWWTKYEFEPAPGPVVCDEEGGKGVIKPWEKFNCPKNEEKHQDCPPSESCDLLSEKNVYACYGVVSFDNYDDFTPLELNRAIELDYVLEMVHLHMDTLLETNLETVLLTGMFYDGNAWRSASMGTKISSVAAALLPDMESSTDQSQRLVINAKKAKNYVTAKLSFEPWQEAYTTIRRQGVVLERSATCNKFIQFKNAPYGWKYRKCGWDWEIAVHPEIFFDCPYRREFFGECCAAGAVTGAQLSACYALESTENMSTQAQVFPRNKIMNGAVPDRKAIDMWKGMGKFKNQMAFINVHCNKTDTSDDWQCYGNGYKLDDDKDFASKCKKLTSQTMCVLVWNKNELVAHNPDYQLMKYMLQFQRFEENGDEKTKNCGFEGTDMKRCPRGRV